MLQKGKDVHIPPRSTPRVRTVRYAFSVAVTSVLLFSLASVMSENSTYVTIETSPTTVTENESFTITVKVKAHVPVNAVDITLSYPESRIVIDGFDTGVSVITLWAEEPYARDGLIHLTGGVFQRGFVGEHTIVRIRAHAVATGIAHVSAKDMTFVAGDGKGTEIVASDSGVTETRISVSTEDGAIESEVTLEIITDIDSDGEVGLADISAFMSAWFSKGKLFDFNDDGRMTFRDFSILLSDSFFK